jgi:antitoxin ParD1/3/4
VGLQSLFLEHYSQAFAQVFVYVGLPSAIPSARFRTPVSSGRYSNASEIVRDALRLLEEREAKLKALRQAAKQGFDEIDQGKGIVLNGKKAISRFIAEIEAEVRTKAAKNGG